ncbi:MAG: hypothetical protein Q9M92_07455 [Enterobacterales bacterium]|nr:hypothetical protein [Enterobacterales bacterium]
MSIVKNVIMPKNEIGNDPNDFKDDPNFVNKLKPPINPFDLNTFALNGESKAMAEKMLDDKYVLGEMALLGDGTIISAKPNAGKTLITIRLLIDGIRTGDIIPENVYYINADDGHKGLTYKLKLAEQYGFKMLSPGYHGFKVDMLLGYMKNATENDTARGVIVILDTLKKIVNPMDKSAMRTYGEIYRPFLARGGTVIMLAHVNKNRDDDGNIVFAGVQDIEDDIDCTYSLDVIEESNNLKTVEFIRGKSRGNNISKCTYRYQTEPGMNYQDRLDSILPINAAQASSLTTKKHEQKLKDEYEVEIIFVLSELRSGTKNQSAIVKALKNNEDFSSEISERGLKKALIKLTGITWNAKRGDRNALMYSLPFNGLQN